MYEEAIMRFLIINGPNMDMLGIREKDKYGGLTLQAIYKEIENYADSLNISAEFVQSNIEGEIINSINKALGVFDGIIINPAAYTHYSVAILDALNSTGLPSIEVHMTNIFAREEYRKKTVTGEACIGIIAGFGKDVYILAVSALLSYINNRG